LEELAGPERRSMSDAAASANLRPEQKKVLFRDSEDHLRRSGGSEQPGGSATLPRRRVPGSTK
jgi:hypothetical protein